MYKNESKHSEMGPTASELLGAKLIKLMCIWPSRGFVLKSLHELCHQCCLSKILDLCRGLSRCMLSVRFLFPSQFRVSHCA